MDCGGTADHRGAAVSHGPGGTHAQIAAGVQAGQIEAAGVADADMACLGDGQAAEVVVAAQCDVARRLHRSGSRHHDRTTAGHRDIAPAGDGQAAGDIQVAQNDVVYVIDDDVVRIDADRAHKLVIGGQYHILACSFNLRPAQHFPAVVVANALGAATDRRSGLDVEVVADPGADHVQAADRSDDHIAAAGYGEIALDRIADVIQNDIAAGTGPHLSDRLTGTTAQAATDGHQGQVAAGQGAAEGHFLVADGHQRTIQAGQRRIEGALNLGITGIESQWTGGVADRVATGHGHLHGQGVAAGGVRSGGDVLHLLGARIECQIAADLNRTRGRDGAAGGQGHCAGGVEGADRQCIDIANRHVCGLSDAQGTAEIVSACQLYRLGQCDRDHRVSGVA